MLFESIQDVAELDSETSPNRIDIYQIKKKDGGEWSFNALTGLPKPDGRKKKVAATSAAVGPSPLGKLYKAGLAFQYLDSNPVGRSKAPTFGHLKSPHLSGV